MNSYKFISNAIKGCCL